MASQSRPRRYAHLPHHEQLEPYFTALDKERGWVRRRFGRRQKHPVPRFLYKYRSIRSAEQCEAPKCHANPIAASHSSVEKARDIIVRSDLWLSAASDFNDPFDASAHLVYRGDANARRARITSMVKNAAPELNRQQRKARVAELMQRPPNELLASVRKSMENLRRTMGICSFAGSARSILMWSHYAGDHAGVCFVFDPTRDYRVFCNAQFVEYSDDYTSINVLNQLEDSLVKVLLTKFTDWKYEGERRIILDGQAHTYLHFDPRALVGVVTGCRAPQFVLDALSTLLAERKSAGLPPIRHLVASQHPTKYRLVIRQA